MKQQTGEVSKNHQRHEQRVHDEAAQQEVQAAQDAQVAALREHEADLTEQVAETISRIDGVLGQIATQTA